MVKQDKGKRTAKRRQAQRPPALVSGIRIRPWIPAAVQPDYPPEVQFETTTRCNAACPICANRSIKRPDMPEELLAKIIKDILDSGKVQRIHPFGTGEPLMDRRLWTILDMFKEAAPQIGIVIFTNAMMLTPKTSGISRTCKCPPSTL